MTTPPKIDSALREKIIAQPDVILDDQDLMQALVDANSQSLGGNIVDLRGIAMDRLETRLDRLEELHRSVIAASYESLSGINQVQRAILRMMDAVDFQQFLNDLQGDVADILRVQSIKLVLETRQSDTKSNHAFANISDAITVVVPGFIEAYLTQGKNTLTRDVTLRKIQYGAEQVYGDAAEFLRSEAALKLDFGRGKLPGLLLMGSDEPHQFTPQHGTDLLAFFGGVFERVMRRWLA